MYVIVFLCFVVVEISYDWMLVTLSVSSRRRPWEDDVELGTSASRSGSPTTDTAASPFVVFVVPALDEELVIERTVRALRAAGGERSAVLVVDDGSRDATAAIVLRLCTDHVWLHRRTGENCRLGKGPALNDAYRLLRDGPLLANVSGDDVIVCIVDADGQLDAETVQRVLARFEREEIAAVQVAARMGNRTTNLLARMQDVEFAVVRHIHERARRRIGSVTLGGCGQFTRLPALVNLGNEPWTDCLTEDLDLGLRMREAGMSLDYEDGGEIVQEAVLTTRALVWQRQRWFQGALQCFSQIRPILRNKQLRRRQRIDLVHSIIVPLLIVQSAIIAPLFLFGVGLWGWHLSSLDSGSREFASALIIGLLGPYLLAFHFVPVTAWAYRRTDGGSWSRAIGLAHLQTVYQYHWCIAGWIGMWRQFAGTGDWTKTIRQVDLDAAEITDTPIGTAAQYPAASTTPAPNEGDRRFL